MSISHSMLSTLRSLGAPRPSRPLAAPPAVPLHVGDLVFIRVTARPFLEVANATACWTNHVGVVVDTDGDEPLIAESTFPLARTTPLSHFVQRSEHGRCAVARLNSPLTPAQCQLLVAAAARRMGRLYDTGFNLHSSRQFCSRFVREVLHEATEIEVGEVETFATLLQRNPNPQLTFWRLWYLGRIPWQRSTVTPANVLRSPHLRVIFDA